MRGVTAVLHAATLHKPHVASHGRQSFVDTNVTGTLNLLEAAVAQRRAGVHLHQHHEYVSAMRSTPPPGAPAAWITEDVAPIPKNIYGVTKVAAEDLCQLFHRNQRLPCLVLRTSRFFPEEDDVPAMRAAWQDDNLKVNELLYRRVDVEDVVSAHLCALDKAAEVGLRTLHHQRDYAVHARRRRGARPRCTAGAAARGPGVPPIYSARGWKMLPTLDRVYVNDRAREVLGWRPQYDFRRALRALAAGADWRSALARQIGAKGYHPIDASPRPDRPIKFFLPAV